MLDYIIAYAIVITVAIVLFRKWLYSQLVTNIPGRYVLITGCDTGFGYQLTLRLESIGVKVFAGCFDANNAKTLFKDYPRIKGLHLDVTQSESIKNAYKVVKDELKENEGLWGLVNNAGIVSLSPVEFIESEEMKKVLDINVVGLAEVTKTFLPLIKKSQGRIVNMSSFVGRFAVQDMGPYVTSKFAVQGYSDVLRLEMKKWGVNVSILEPGMFRTGIATKEKMVNFFEEWMKRRDLSDDDELKECYSGHNYNKEELLNRKSSYGSRDVHLIIEAYEHALFALHPKRRYKGFQPIYQLYLFLTHLPEIVLDNISKRIIFPHPNYNYYKNSH